MTNSASLTVGITGHRPNRLSIGGDELQRKCRDVFRALASGGDGRHPVALSALAEGADRAFAHAALSCGFRMQALLPFSSADYEATFSDPQQLADYRSLLEKAGTVEELPGSLSASKDAYAALGAEIVSRSDIIIAVWDGGHAAGKGGTPDIIEYALANATPVIWIDARHPRLPRLLAIPTAQGPRHVPLEILASRSKPLTRTRLAKLARL